MGHGMTQDRSLSHKVIHLTRHGGFKADDFLGTDMGPLGMRSGQANDALERGMRGQKSRYLGFLASQNCGLVAQL